MGGYVALAFARKYPERLAGLALVASHPAEDTPEARMNRYRMIESIREHDLQTVVAGMSQKLTSDPALRSHLVKIMRSANQQGVIGALEGMAERASSWDVLAAINLPVLAIAGQEDEIVPEERVRKMESLLLHGRVIRLPGCAHMPMMEAPEMVAKALLQFMSVCN